MPSNHAFDLEATLKRLDGDRGLFRELIVYFLEDSPKVAEHLKASLRAGDAPASERAAHSLKGLTANVGSGPASILAGRMEESARKKDLATATELVDQLEQEMTRLTAALKKFQAAPDPVS